MFSITRPELEQQLLTPSLSDKAEIVQNPTKTLRMGGKGIAKMSGVCGGKLVLPEPELPFGY
jgi:hypothetical protein